MNTYRLLKRTTNNGYSKLSSVDYVVQRKILFFWVEWKAFTNIDDAHHFLVRVKAKEKVITEIIE